MSKGAGRAQLVPCTFNLGSIVGTRIVRSKHRGTGLVNGLPSRNCPLVTPVTGQRCRPKVHRVPPPLLVAKRRSVDSWRGWLWE